MDGWMYGWMDGCMDVWVDGRMDGCNYVCIIIIYDSMTILLQ